MKQELLAIYEIIKKNQKVLENIESGFYSGGKMKINIDLKDRPVLPKRSTN